MNAIGDIDGRLRARRVVAARARSRRSATFSPAKFVKCTPCQIAVQIRAYERGLMKRPPDACCSQFGLFGSFQASQYFTAGR